ncbi:hypothetical protein AZI87_03270 [Bdellovibrio bacteriovorus]|uniref:DUF481 domain-containing protein n=1 Tax=Bdellovibrio bacteriovorus TaxID=959 RepID=A0A162GJB8_BDEBC|nr:hypothetical protein [Bdellovibrio bacteriovorus]KYG68290.1 hypothetical protein AZI87_03270 [Bdellovibrio bacteriovorus]
MKLTFRHLILFLFFLMCRPGFAQEAVSVIRDPSPKKSWNIKVEMEAKSTFDKDKNVNGYTTEADLQITRMWSENYGTVFGAQVGHKVDDEETRSQMEEATLGLRVVQEFWELKWRTQLTYNYILREEQRLKDFRDGSLMLDIRTNIPLQRWGKARLRLKHAEYLPTKTEDDIEIRQTKLELSPSYLWGRFATGFKNQISRLSTFAENLHTLDVAPFIKYEGAHFEPMLKIIYRPVEKSAQFHTAQNWESHPIYALEMEMNF